MVLMNQQLQVPRVSTDELPKASALA
ncbi:Protein of unknown function [Propionibacterium freudenreichii]|nr:Protein of unknown function [Propionibacterium freudenreichii]CEI33267.1 Protein of unknown function [Propionibacterium freudenreichii]